MRIRTQVPVGVLALALLNVTGTAAAPQDIREPDAATIAEFNRRVNAYVDLHRLLEGTVPTLKVSS